MSKLKERVISLCRADGVGNIREASDLAFNMLTEYCECEKTDNLTVIGILKGESDYTLMLDAHIDQIAMVVTDVDDNGFLTVSNAGGIDIRALPSRRVTVHGKEKITAVFCSIPPHLSKGEEVFEDISALKLDTALGNRAKDIISVGDYVTFKGEVKELLNGRLSGNSLDNRLSVAGLITVAERLKDKKLPFNVAFVLSDGEELGLRGSRTASFKVNPQEAIAIDVSFGDGIGISSEECSPLGSGAMIGISPVLDMEVSQKLVRACNENNIPYTLEVMGGKTGTNADMISLNREGVKTGTLSIPIRNMHSAVEVADLKDLESACNALCEYILSGGAMNA